MVKMNLDRNNLDFPLKFCENSNDFLVGVILEKKTTKKEYNFLEKLCSNIFRNS